jgi:hypothetical protein
VISIRTFVGGVGDPAVNRLAVCFFPAVSSALPSNIEILLAAHLKSNVIHLKTISSICTVPTTTARVISLHHNLLKATIPDFFYDDLHDVVLFSFLNAKVTQPAQF